MNKCYKLLSLTEMLHNCSQVVNAGYGDDVEVFSERIQGQMCVQVNYSTPVAHLLGFCATQTQIPRFKKIYSRAHEQNCSVV